jgi:hypothetical protein
VKGSLVFLCVLRHLSHPFRPEHTVALVFCAHPLPFLNKNKQQIRNDTNYRTHSQAACHTEETWITIATE